MTRISSLLGWAAALVIVTGRSHAEVPSSARWDKAFPVSRAPVAVHFRAHYAGPDGVDHRLEAWRNGNAYLRRQTDGALDLYVVARAGDYAYRFIDHRRHMVIDVDRTNLYRIGIFSDWFGLAHVVDRPKVSFTAEPSAKLAGEKVEGCAWRTIERRDQGQVSRSRVCWSAAWGIPLLIREQDAQGVWRDRFTVDAVDGSVPSDASGLPAAPDAYAVIDASESINPHAGD